MQGTYGGDTDSRLISPPVTLAAVSGQEKVYLRFWEWFAYGTWDAGYIEISVWDTATGTWSAWTTVDEGITDTSQIWSQRSVDLTAYAGATVRIAFYHTASRAGYTWIPSEGAGWFVDDIRLQ
jgi:hypothetical protein